MSKLSGNSGLWLEPEDIHIPENLAATVGGHPLVAQALVQRGVVDAVAAQAFIDPTYYTPADPEQLPGLVAASERLQRAIQLDERILVWGDFDVDGQTATTLLVSGLRDLGARVNHHIPIRATESHGVHLPTLKRYLDKSNEERPSVLLTCDTGISAHKSVIYAQQNEVTVIITDHHDLPPNLPDAAAIVNPKMLPEGHPLATLPGVGVAYKLMEALYKDAGRSAELEPHLDLLALGIVADLALLRSDSRYLLQRGLNRLRTTQRLGLLAMLELIEIDPAQLTEEHIGFIIAPRLNALGRLSDANPVVEFLTTQDIGPARIFALDLEGLNARRKLLTDQVYRAAISQVESDPILLESHALVLAHPAWPAGVLGIVASRLVDRFHKPVILLTNPEGGMARGSARSIPGVDITAAIRTQEALLHRFGGHPMAAGLSLDPERIPEFRHNLSCSVVDMLGEAPSIPSLQIDGYLELAELSLDLVADLERLAPFGSGNPPLTLASHNLFAVSQAPVGRDGEHRLLTVEDEHGETCKVIWWQGGGETVPQGRFDLAYTVRSSNYRGQPEVQVEWVDTRPVNDPPEEISTGQPPKEIIDYRNGRNPKAMLERWQDKTDPQVWVEAEHKEQVGGQNRLELVPGESLAIWTIPPGPVELQAALQAVSADTLILFAVDAGMDDFEPFAQRLAGLVKYALNSNQGQASITALAAATAQRNANIRTALTWLQARGAVHILRQEGDTIWLGEGENASTEELPDLTIRLKSMLAETAAYRAYFMRADAEALVTT